jgi:hypothetical protein
MPRCCSRTFHLGQARQVGVGKKTARFPGLPGLQVSLTGRCRSEALADHAGGPATSHGGARRVRADGLHARTGRTRSTDGVGRDGGLIRAVGDQRVLSTELDNAAICALAKALATKALVTKVIATMAVRDGATHRLAGLGVEVVAVYRITSDRGRGGQRLCWRWMLVLRHLLDLTTLPTCRKPLPSTVRITLLAP